MPQGVPGADHGRAVQLGSDLLRVEQDGGRDGCRFGGRLTAGRVGQRPDRQLDIVPELPV